MLWFLIMVVVLVFLIRRGVSLLFALNASTRSTPPAPPPPRRFESSAHNVVDAEFEEVR